MGKKVEKALKGQQQPSATSQDGADDDGERPYTCTGNLYNDFPELCKRNNMAAVPLVIPRAKRPPSPSAPSVPEPAAKGKKGKEAVKEPQPEPEPEVGENGEPVDPPPKTYTTRDKFEYFKPSLQVEQDHPDKGDTVTELFVRGWKIDDSMMQTLSKCWQSMNKLHTINLWNVGITAPVLNELAFTLTMCENVKSLTLESNPIPEENFFLFLKDEAHIQHLSLRYNCITDKGADLLGNMLGSMKKRNEKLISLNLAGNSIGDKGAIGLARGLRTNRCLLSLTLTSNKIGNVGSQKLGEVLSRFPLTHEEIVERRKALSERSSPDRGRSVVSPPPSRRADSKDRPGSVRSGNDKTKGGTQQRDKSSKAKKDPKDDKNDKTLKGTKTQKEADKTKGTKGGSHGPRKSPVGSTSTEGTKAAAKTKGSKGKDKGKDKGKEESEPSENPEQQNPLLDPNAESMDGALWIPGNRTLINLNLARNDLDESGLKPLLLAVQYQATISAIMKTGGTGLMRLNVAKNKFAADNEHYSKLTGLMATKDPFYKPESPDQASQQS